MLGQKADKLGRKKEVFFVKRGLDKGVFYGIIREQLRRTHKFNQPHIISI